MNILFDNYKTVGLPFVHLLSELHMNFLFWTLEKSIYYQEDWSISPDLFCLGRAL